MQLEVLFDELWSAYVNRTPSAQKIKDLFSTQGNVIVNDHVAFRTYDDPRVDIDVLSRPFIELGYKECGEYHFEKKKLYAKHFEHPTDDTAPRVFISQLLTQEFSTQLQSEVKRLIDTISEEELHTSELVLKGRLWEQPSYQLYQQFLEESEYAAWLYVNGFCANHFTVDVNQLTTFNSLQEVNSFLKENGFQMNTSGGEIKGTPEQLLEQSSVLADTISIEFQEGTYPITSCYYEFAYRHLRNNGELFSGFIANSADKIFESTDMKLQKG